MKSIAFVSAVIASFLVACGAPEAAPTSSANDDSKSNPSNDANDTLSMDASSDTTDAIGVTRWGASSTSDDTTTIRGYDAKGEVLVTVTHKVSGATITDSVSGKQGSATLQVQNTTTEPDEDGVFTATTKILKNTFKAGDAPSKVFALALADQGDNAENWGEASSVTGGGLTGSGTALGTESLHPMAPVGLSTPSSSGSSGDLIKCGNVTLACGEALAKTAAGAIKGGKNCLTLGKDISLVQKCKNDKKPSNFFTSAIAYATCTASDWKDLKDHGTQCVSGVQDGAKGAGDVSGSCWKDTPECKN